MSKLFLICCLGLLGCSSGLHTNTPTAGEDSLELISVEKVWDRAAHNGFTGLARFKGHWYISFREGDTHGVDLTGSIRIIRMDPGGAWRSVGLIEDDSADLREGHLSVNHADDEMLLLGTRAYPGDAEVTHRSFAVSTKDGQQWSQMRDAGEPNFWLSMVESHETGFYTFGNNTQSRSHLRLYHSKDGHAWAIHAADLGLREYPNAASIVFADHGSAYCLLRRDRGDMHAKLGKAQPPFTQWRWHDLGIRIGAPAMVELPDGRLLASMRLYPEGSTIESGWEVWLGWVDPVRGTLTPTLQLPAGGDCGNPSMIVEGDTLWMSYYSSHEGKSSIYLAKINISGME